MTSDRDPTPDDSLSPLQLQHPAETWHGGKRYVSAEQALLTALADDTADQHEVMLQVLREKFAGHPDAAALLMETDASALEQLDLTPSHTQWTGREALDALLRMRQEIAGQEVMRTGMLLATHGSLVLMGRESDLGRDLTEGARRVGLTTVVPSDGPGLASFEDAMADAISERWGDVAAELFEMGKTILLFLSMDGIADEESEYQEARDQTRGVLQESADRLHLSEEIWTIIEAHESDPAHIVDILRDVVVASLRASDEA